VSVWAVLAAAGSGERLGTDRPKAFVRLGEQPLLAESLERLGVSELVAVGCDPDAWARDLSRFIRWTGRRQWRLERLAVLDLFPQTPHVESLALLRRD